MEKYTQVSLTVSDGVHKSAPFSVAVEGVELDLKLLQLQQLNVFPGVPQLLTFQLNLLLHKSFFAEDYKSFHKMNSSQLEEIQKNVSEVVMQRVNEHFPVEYFSDDPGFFYKHNNDDTSHDLTLFLKQLEPITFFRLDDVINKYVLYVETG